LCARSEFSCGEKRLHGEASLPDPPTTAESLKSLSRIERLNNRRHTGAAALEPQGEGSSHDSLVETSARSTALNGLQGLPAGCICGAAETRLKT
jgi:hypothetical protein